MKKITHAEIAGELKLSRATVTRVLRNDRCVRKETRKRVLDHLNKIGYYNQKHFAQEKILFCYRGSQPSMIKGLVETLKKKPFFRDTVFAMEDLHQDRGAFLREAETASVLVFFGKRNEEDFILAREANPDLYIIHAMAGGMRCANVAIEPDNTTSGRLAAEYLYRKNHRDILMAALAGNPNSMQRVKSFAAEFMFRFASCRVEVHLIHGPDPLWEEKFFQILQRRKSPPSAIVCMGCSLQEGIIRQVKRVGLSVPEDVSILSHDNPEDFNTKVTHSCDAVVFDLREILRLVEYFLVCRPLAAEAAHLSVSPEIRLECHGTVKHLPEPVPDDAEIFSGQEGVKSRIILNTTYPEQKTGGLS